MKSLFDVQGVLKIFSELNVSSGLLSADNNGFVTLEAHGLQRKVPITELTNCAKKLVTLKNCNGFFSYSTGFNNPTQFCDTMFEVDCAYSMLLANQ